MTRLSAPLLVFFSLFLSAINAAEKPNIVWIVVEDMSAHFGCYGETAIETPNVDNLAKEGVLFRNAFITAPVCSTARSAMITGMYQTSIGAHHHRSGRGEVKIQLPDEVRLIPEYFREAGYYVTNKSKTDYNFEWDPSIYDGKDWTKRKAGQPFFAQFQLIGGKMRGNANSDRRRLQKLVKRVDTSLVQLPPYYPPHPEIIKDWADYLETVLVTDLEVGEIVDQLKEQGELQNTYIFFITDHGISHARGKQFCYDEGIHIPFIVSGPGLESGSIRDDLIIHIDMAATSLALAGIEIPEYMQAVDLFAEAYQVRDYVVSARDRCDETVERIRSVRTSNYKYIRNYYPQRPHLQPNRYKDDKTILKAIREWDEKGKLNPVQSSLTAPSRPYEELYDLNADPWEIRNLSNNPQYAMLLQSMRDKLSEWIEETNDLGQTPESDEMYDSDMEVYQSSRNSEQFAVLERNIEIMKRWRDEGK